MISCTFAGHWEVYSRNVESSIEFAIESILKKDNSFVFYSGDMGEFDKMCSAAVRTAKRRHPELDIKLMVVLPYMMAKINTDMLPMRMPAAALSNTAAPLYPLSTAFREIQSCISLISEKDMTTRLSRRTVKGAAYGITDSL